MIAASRGSGVGAVMARPPLVVSALPLRRDTAPHCQAGLPPDIRAGLLVGGTGEHLPGRGLTMKAIRTHEQTGIRGLRFEEAPDPQPMFCEVLVKVEACGITHNELDWPI